MDLRTIFQMPEMKRYLLSSAIGLEKENIRIHEDGNIACTPHPFGDKARHPFITTDFSESQVEIGTEVCSNPDMVYDQLENLHDIVTTTVAVENPEPEYLWPMSNPPLIGDPDQIPVAKYVGESHEKETYREYLIKNDLRSASYEEWYNGLVEAVPMTMGDTRYIRTDLVMNTNG